MSIQAMSWALAQRIVTSASGRHVLLCLANYAGEDGRNAFPSVARLCDDTGLSERAVRNNLRDLEELGVIKPGNQAIAAAFISRADRRPTVYDIDLSRGAEDAPRSRTGGTSFQNGGHLVPERGAAGAPDPSLKPSIEPEAAATREADDRLFGLLLDAAGQAVDPTRYSFQDLNRPKAWLAAGCDLELDVLPAIGRVCRDKPPMSVKSWGYFDGPVMDAMRQRTKPLPTASPASSEARKPFVQKLYGMNSDGDRSRDQNANSRTDAALLGRASGDGRGQPGISDQRVSGLVQTALRRGA